MPSRLAPLPKKRVTPRVAIGFCVVLYCTHAGAQWTVVNLNPAGSSYSWAWGVQGGEQAGAVVVGADWHASTWTGSAASWTDLHPLGAQWSEAWSVGGGKQVGRAKFGAVWHAALWSGTAASWIDLAPPNAGESVAVAVEGGQQVGWSNVGAGPRPCLWSGTASSWVELTPAGSTVGAALGVRGGKQVGWANFSGYSHAGIWSGTASSWIDLDPPGSYGSIARDIDGDEQVGDMVDGFYIGRASLWRDTAASWVDLSPVDTFDSIAYAVQAGQQVGVAKVPPGFAHAFYWTGTADSAVDLHSYLPSEFNTSEARDIWVSAGTTYVAGFGHRPDGTTAAVLWVRTPSCTMPGAPVSITTVAKNAGGNHDPVLYCQDPNPPTQVTGYNVYRSSQPSPAPATWPRVATNVVDIDPVAPNVQWTDTSGDVSPTGIWFYEVTAFNNLCPAQTAEGPF